MPSSKSDKKFLKELKRKDMKRKKLKEKKRSRHRVKSDSSSDSSSDESDMDLQKEMYPISHYVNDREEMINQVFSVIKGPKLKSMLPPFLVDLDLDELKGLCLDQLIGISKKRISCVLAGQEMVESSDTDDDSDVNTDDTDIGDNGRDSAEPRKSGGNRSDEDDDNLKVSKSVVSEDPGAATRLQKVNRINFGKKEVNKVVLSGERKRERKESEKRESREARESSEGNKGEKGKTLMELLELEMRARAIKALLMKAGKEEGEAETLAIEEALDEQKKKEKDGPKEEVKKDRHLRKRSAEDAVEEVQADQDLISKKKKEESEDEEEPEKVYNSENKAMNKAREALMLSENRKIIQDEIKLRKEDEAKFMYEEQVRKEKMEKEKEEREKLIQEVKLMKQKMIEGEQEERRKVLEKEREKMKKDHLLKEQMKQQKDKDKLMNKIKAIKDEEEREKEMLDEHYKTKMFKKIVERADEDEELVLDEEEEQKMRRYRRKEDGVDGSDHEDDLKERSRSRGEYDRGGSRSNSEERVRKPYSRDQSWSPESDSDSKTSKFVSRTRLKKKVADGSDVEDGEVEEVDSDAEDEVDREEDQLQLLQKMKNLRKKMSKMEDEKVNEDSVPASGITSPQPNTSARGGRGRGRGARGRGRGRGRGKPGSGSDEDEWSMKKYDFDAPDIKEAVESHKPNFVKAPRRVFEKHDGYYSEEEDEEDEEDENEEDGEMDVTEVEKEGDDGEDSNNKQQMQPGDNQQPIMKKEHPAVKNEELTVAADVKMSASKDEFKRVTRAEWNTMGYKEKKKYLKERRKRKQIETVFIKDDSDNEQLSGDDGEEMEDLEFSDSEDEKDKGERLAKEALKSYAKAFTKEEHPEDYKLVMRKDTVEADLADAGDANYETIEDIELRDKREKMESKEKEKKNKMREDRIKRMQAFQASSVLREEPKVIEEEDEMEDDDEDEVIEEKEPESNPFYSSYKQAIENEEELDDPLKEERERSRLKLEEDEKELKKLEEEIQVKKLKESPEPPQAKKIKTEFEKYSGVGVFKTMIDSEKEKIQQELTEGEAKNKVETALEEEKRKKSAEKVLKKSRRRGDPNNPSKEEMDAAQELEQLTWQDRYMKNKRVKDVVSSSKMFSKVKNKLKLEKTEKELEVAPGVSTETSSEDREKEAAKPVTTKPDLPGMIGSLEEYASLVGKSVGQLAEAKYEPPEVESSDESEGEQGEEEGNLWGAIMGGK